ncbi:helix-turn-helix domain-containing protein [Pseudobutyrivibrio sp. AR14]|uniref:helix-turn-helix domain-containing protein n=1 Tax=Pseudobutyrivibrio sp. AR14 TaxID=1520804 RepID=UPI002E8DEAE3|nr:helix-turn-helix domain-containing protein [Pseudobutyrivibrio sp. AR14]
MYLFWGRSENTIYYVASVLKTSQTMYARYERGANELPIHHLIALCKLYNISADYILGLTDKK